MLPKKNRVDTKTVEKIFKTGKSLSSPSLTFRFILDKNSNIPRISFIVPKSAAKLAIRRNFLRRHGYTALEKHIQNFPAGLLGVFIFKKYQDNILIIEDEIKNILAKIN